MHLSLYNSFIKACSGMLTINGCPSVPAMPSFLPALAPHNCYPRQAICGRHLASKHCSHLSLFPLHHQGKNGLHSSLLGNALHA